MFQNYFKTAFRNLWKNKLYGSLNVIGLAIGIACAGLIFLWVENEISYNHNNSKRDQLYQILENQTYEGKTYTFSATPGLLAIFIALFTISFQAIKAALSNPVKSLRTE